MPDYKIGGYHPVHVGEILLDRYVIIQKLGWGHFSTVWLTKDLKHNSYVAMKVQKSAQHYLEAAYDEVEILDQVATNWKSEDWERSVEKFYKDDPHLKAFLEKYGMSGDTSHCVQLLNSFIHHVLINLGTSLTLTDSGLLSSFPIELFIIIEKVPYLLIPSSGIDAAPLCLLLPL